MAIICKQCQYVLTPSAVMGDLTGKVCDFTISTILPFLLKRGPTDDFFLFFANQQKMKCPICYKYKEWTFIKDESVEPGEEIA